MRTALLQRTTGPSLGSGSASSARSKARCRPLAVTVRSSYDPWSRSYGGPGSGWNSKDLSSLAQAFNAARQAGSGMRDFDGRYPEDRRSQEDSRRSSNGNSSGDQRASSSATATATEPKPRPTPGPEPNMDELSDEERANVRLFRGASPSVVNVTASMAGGSFMLNMFALPRGVGSGFVWTDTGVVVTNAHVVENVQDVRVTLWDQTTYKAKVVGKDRDKDIAVLQLDIPRSELDKLRPLALGSSDSLLVGQKVFAIGNPFGEAARVGRAGLDQTLTQGIVSGLGREIGGRAGKLPISNVIQTDAAINPGNSGGPLLDSRGRVVGINTAILDPTGVGISSGVGFAIPINAVKGMVDQLLRYGRVIRPSLGISLAPNALFRMQGRTGVLVMDVVRDGPAAAAGMQGTRREGGWGEFVLGDVIVGINGRRVREQKDLFAALDECKVGDQVDVEVLRNGNSDKKMTLRVTLTDRRTSFE